MLVNADTPFIHKIEIKRMCEELSQIKKQRNSPLNHTNSMNLYAFRRQVLVHFFTKLTPQHIIQCNINIIAIIPQELQHHKKNLIEA